MLYVFMGLFAAAVVALDQFTKALVQSHIAVHLNIPAVPGLFHLTHEHNTGGAFSLLEGQQWLFVLVFALLAMLIVWEFAKKRLPFRMLERWCIIAVFAGGLGNMLDRLRLGYVVDMIEVEFITFPVFNVADCFITCGCILLIVSLVFFNRDFWKDEKK